MRCLLSDPSNRVLVGAKRRSGGCLCVALHKTKCLSFGRKSRYIARMAEHAKKHNISLRPHAKTHKSAAIARMQLQYGALGICVAKLGEA